MKLTNVTLLGIDCVNVERLQAAMDVCQKDIEFGAVKLLTSLPTDDVRLVKISHIGNVQEYSRFCAEELVKYVDTDFVLLVQYDGFILNPGSWTDEFLKYDYIGASWLVANWSVRDFNFPVNLLGTKVVGNGGFSLRSKKFLKVSAKLMREGKIPQIHPEDVSLCVWHKDLLDREGISIAPPELADKFSIEGDDEIYDKQFGFHGFSWTDIDKWINEHSEYALIVTDYKKQRISRFHRCLIQARDQALKDAQKVFQDKAIEAHVFGSVARRDSDPYSDLDVWLTFEDEEIKKVIDSRLEYYSKIGKIVHVCEPPQNAPINGVHSFILYKTYIGLLQVDYYICPRSTSFLTTESKKVFGNIELPKGELVLNPQKVTVDEKYRIDFVLTFVFIAIKNVARKEKDALDNLFREYDYLSDRYGVQVDQLENREHTFDVLKKIINNLRNVSDEQQKKVLLEIEAFLNEVKKYSKEKSETRDIPVRHRATAIIKKDDKFLLFHRIKPGHDYFMFPGGGVEEGETVEDALKREVKEELNISVGNFRPLFVVDNIYAPAWATIHPGQKQMYHLFMVKDYAGIPELGGPEKSQANDQNEYILAWLSLDEIKQLDNVVPKEVVKMFLKTMNNGLNPFG